MKVFLFFLFLTLTNAWPTGNGKKSNPMYNEGLYEGDIAGIDPKERNIVSNRAKAWTNNTIYYVIDDNLNNMKEYIEVSMRRIEKDLNNCIKFVNSKGNGNYIDIKSHKGCWSYIGMRGGKQTLSLSDGCHFYSTYYHELGHALGFYHEHNRSDRDDHIKILWDNVLDDKTYNFRKALPFQNSLVTPFDLKSIMIYDSYAFSKNGKPTILTISGESIKGPGHDDTFTKNDIKELMYLYKCGDVKIPVKKNKTLEDFFCDFENDDCKFLPYRPSTVTTERISENGNTYLKVVNFKEKYNFNSITAGTYIRQTPEICISFRYKLSKGSLLNNFFELTPRNPKSNDGVIILKKEVTEGWINVRKTVKTPENISYKIKWMIENQNGHYEVSLDDFRVSFKRC